MREFFMFYQRLILRKFDIFMYLTGFRKLFFSSIYDNIQISQVKNWLTVLMLRYFLIFIKTYHCVKMSKYVVISGPYFPVFGLNTEIYGVNLRIQSEYRKIRTRNSTVFGLISRSVFVLKFRSYIDETKKLHCLCNY